MVLLLPIQKQAHNRVVSAWQAVFYVYHGNPIKHDRKRYFASVRRTLSRDYRARRRPPGIVNTITRHVSSCGCNIEDSRLAMLGEEFTFIMLLSGSWNAITLIESTLPQKARSWIC